MSSMNPEIIDIGSEDFLVIDSSESYEYRDFYFRTGNVLIHYTVHYTDEYPLSGEWIMDP